MAGNHNYRNISKSSKQHHRQPKSKHDNGKYYGCGICKADHRLVSCKKFTNMNLDQKHKIVRQLHYCSNCLARNHLLDKCPSKERCRVCSQKHHTTLHGHQRVLSNLEPSRSRKVRTSSATTVPSTTKTTGLPSSLNKVLIPTARLHAMTEEGCVSIRAIVNPSSITSRISSSFVEKHKLTKVQLNGRNYIQLTVTPNMSSIDKYEIYLMVVRDLPKLPYPTSIRETIKKKFENIILADPEFYTNDPIEMELGGDIYCKVLKPNIIRNDGSSIMAQDSCLGWLIMGSYSE